MNSVSIIKPHDLSTQRHKEYKINYLSRSLGDGSALPRLFYYQLCMKKGHFSCNCILRCHGLDLFIQYWIKIQTFNYCIVQESLSSSAQSRSYTSNKIAIYNKIKIVVLQYVLNRMRTLKCMVQKGGPVEHWNTFSKKFFMFSLEIWAVNVISSPCKFKHTESDICYLPFNKFSIR